MKVWILVGEFEFTGWMVKHVLVQLSWLLVGPNRYGWFKWPSSRSLRKKVCLERHHHQFFFRQLPSLQNKSTAIDRKRLKELHQNWRHWPASSKWWQQAPANCPGTRWHRPAVDSWLLNLSGSHRCNKLNWRRTKKNTETSKKRHEHLWDGCIRTPEIEDSWWLSITVRDWEQ